MYITINNKHQVLVSSLIITGYVSVLDILLKLLVITAQVPFTKQAGCRWHLLHIDLLAVLYAGESFILQENTIMTDMHPLKTDLVFIIVLKFNTCKENCKNTSIYY